MVCEAIRREHLIVAPVDRIIAHFASARGRIS